MINIRSIICNPFQERCYVLWDDTKAAAVIDCGCSSLAEQKRLQDIVTRHDLHIEAHYATHAHLDHLFGAAWLHRTYGVPTFLHPADMPLAERLRQQAQSFGFPWDDWDFPISTFNFQPSTFNFQLSTLHTPGHSLGSVCFYLPEDKVLFSGDTLFQCGMGRTDLWGGDYQALMRSLETLRTLPPDTRVLPGHGGETTIAAESALTLYG